MRQILRVCVVTESYYPVVGGTETHLRGLVAGLQARGIQPLVVTLRCRPELSRHEVLDGAEVYRVSRGYHRWRALPAVWRTLRRLRRHYELIYVGGFRALGLPAVLAGRHAQKPVVLRAANNGEFSGAFFDPALRRLGLSHESPVVRSVNGLRQRVLREADCFVAIAKSLQVEFERGGVPPDRITTIPNGVDSIRFSPAPPEEKAALRRRLSLPRDGIIACFTGRLVRWKGPLDLLAAWGDSQAAARGTLLFLGAGGADMDNCEAAAQEFVTKRGLRGSVRFVGDVTNVEDYLRAADLFALPTYNDAFPNAVLEAMGTGLPVITTRVAGLADYAADGVNALCVQPGDVRGLCVCLNRLLADDALRARLGQAARETAREFSMDRAVDRHARLFRSLAERDDDLRLRGRVV